MGFFSAVGQVISNQKNFRQWEKDDANKQEQRQALAQKGINQAELQKAANKGKVIMDVIDIMDTHSEEVAENTETAVMPIAQTFPALASLFTMLGVGKLYTIPKGKAYDNAVNNFIFSKFDKQDAGIDVKFTKNGSELFTIIEKLKEKAKNAPDNEILSKIKLAEVDFMLPITGTKLAAVDKHDAGTLTSIFNKKNMKLLSQSNDGEIKELYSKLSEIGKEFANTHGIKNNSFTKLLGSTVGIVAGISAFAFVAANIVAAKIQVKSSRIARWQSREDLKDPKYFVQYTDEQIKEAQKNVEANKANEKKGLFKNKEQKGIFKYSDNNSFFKSLKATINNKKYNDWKANYNLEDRKVKRNLTPEELKEAEKEQEVIQRVTKIINNKAEEYSEDMETTASVLIGGTPYLGLAIGAIINTILTKTGLGEKFSRNKFEKLIKNIPYEPKKDELKKLYNNIKPAANNKEATGFVAKTTQMIQNTKNFGKYYEGIMDAFKSNAGNKKGVSRALSLIKDAFNTAMTTKTGRNVLVGFAGSMITGTVGAFIGLKLQKSAARAGRYKAKRELEEKSENFIGYTKEDFNSVNDIKAKKKPVIQKMGEYLTFIPRVIKDYYNYEKYKKNQADYDKKLLNELTKLNVSDKQLQEGRELQRKLFTTFESVDDKSQEYSEAIEAVTEMSQPLLPYLAIGIASIPLLLTGRKLIKGGAPKAAESITGFFAKHTRFLKGKAAKKYSDGVAENIKGIVQKQKVSSKIDTNPAIKMMTDISSSDNGAKLLNELQSAIQSSKGKDNELKALLNTLADNPRFKKQISEEELTKGINSIIQTAADLYGSVDKTGDTTKSIKELQANIEPMLKGCNSISDITKKILSQAEIPNVKISEMDEYFNALSSIGINMEHFKQGLKSNNISGVANALVQGKIQSGEWRKLLDGIQDGMSESVIKNMIKGLAHSSMTDEQALKIYNNISTILKNVPKKELQKIIDTAMEEFAKNPAKFMQALQSGQLRTIFITKGVATAAVVTPAAWGLISILIAFIIESTFASMQKQAGRLGVMKAIEELQDVRFYADMKSSDKNNESNTTKIESSVSNTINQKSVNEIFNSLRQK